MVHWLSKPELFEKPVHLARIKHFVDVCRYAGIPVWEMSNAPIGWLDAYAFAYAVENGLNNVEVVDHDDTNG
jgi:hypothetical protein